MYIKFHDDGGVTIKMDGHCPNCGYTGWCWVAVGPAEGWYEDFQCPECSHSWTGNKWTKADIQNFVKQHNKGKSGCAVAFLALISGLSGAMYLFRNLA